MVFCLSVCLKIYLFMRDTERGRDIGRGRRAGSMQESNEGLNPGTLGSHPELKARAQLLSHSAVPESSIF